MKTTKAEVMRRVKGLDDARRNATVCVLVGHSGIQTVCFGYYSCARCGAQVGDTLAGSYDPAKIVVIGHNCKTCQANYEAMGWQDKLFAPDPFERATPDE